MEYKVRSDDRRNISCYSKQSSKTESSTTQGSAIFPSGISTCTASKKDISLKQEPTFDPIHFQVVYQQCRLREGIPIKRQHLKILTYHQVF